MFFFFFNFILYVTSLVQILREMGSVNGRDPSARRWQEGRLVVESGRLPETLGRLLLALGRANSGATLVCIFLNLFTEKKSFCVATIWPFSLWMYLRRRLHCPHPRQGKIACRFVSVSFFINLHFLFRLLTLFPRIVISTWLSALYKYRRRKPTTCVWHKKWWTCRYRQLWISKWSQ